MVLVKISGLRPLDSNGKHDASCIEMELSWDTKISDIFRSSFEGQNIVPLDVTPTSRSNATILGFKKPRSLVASAHNPLREFSEHSSVPETREITVHDLAQSDFPTGTINIDDSLIHFANLEDDQGELVEASLDCATSTSGFLKLEVDRNLHIQFHRTVRMPDDNRLHQLPPSLGVFPLYNVSAFSDRLPGSIAKSGGVFLPMWQREAMWIQLESSDSEAMYAVRVNVGQVNAISGLTLEEKSRKQDYVRIERHPPPPNEEPPLRF